MPERDSLHRKEFGKIYRDDLGPSDVPYEYYHLFHPTMREQASNFVFAAEGRMNNTLGHKRELFIAAGIGVGVLTGIIFLSRKPQTT